MSPNYIKFYNQLNNDFIKYRQIGKSKKTKNSKWNGLINSKLNVGFVVVHMACEYSWLGQQNCTSQLIKTYNFFLKKKTIIL